MSRTRIKICGVTRPEDGALAARLGADAIGMIFHPPSRRNISIDRAREIVATLPPFVTPVGVFVDAPLDRILEIAAAVRIQLIQLHGQESPDAMRDLKLPFTKALKVDASLPAQLTLWRQTPVCGIVLETPSSSPGGTGLANDFPAIAHHQSQNLFANLPLVIAGGLTPENVAAVIQSLRPHAVNVSSGVEGSVGVKSPAKLQAFFKAVATAKSKLTWL